MWDKLTAFFSNLLPDDMIDRIIAYFEHNLSRRDPAAWAQDLLLSALIAVVVGVLIDLWLYWSRKDRREILLHKGYRFLEFFRILGDLVMSLIPERKEAPSPDGESVPAEMPEKASAAEANVPAEEVPAQDLPLQTQETAPVMPQEVAAADASATSAHPPEPTLTDGSYNRIHSWERQLAQAEEMLDHMQEDLLHAVSDTNTAPDLDVGYVQYAAMKASDKVKASAEVPKPESTSDESETTAADAAAIDGQDPSVPHTASEAAPDEPAEDIPVLPAEDAPLPEAERDESAPQEDAIRADDSGFAVRRRDRRRSSGGQDA